MHGEKEEKPLAQQKCSHVCVCVSQCHRESMVFTVLSFIIKSKLYSILNVGTMAQPHTATDNTLQVVTAQPTASPPSVQRKVSIANDVVDNRYDNLAFEPCSKRKGSQVCVGDLYCR